METIFVIFLIIALTLLSSALSSSEIALFSLPSNKLKSYRHQLDPKKRLIAKLLTQSKSLLVTIFLLNTIANILVQNLTSDLFPDDGNWQLKVGVPLFLILIFGELLPKYLGLLYNESISLATAPIYNVVQRMTKPLRHVITEFADFFSRILFFFLKAEKPLSADELEHALLASQNAGLIHKDELAFIQGYLSLEERRVKDLMIPRQDVSFYNKALPLTKLIFLLKQHSEVLICIANEEGSCASGQEQIIGTICAKDYFTHREQIHHQDDLAKIIRTPFFIPETSPIKILLQALLQQQKQMAVVVDEYGAFSGLIRREELAEILTKEAAPKEASIEYTRVSSDAIIAHSKMALQDLRDLYDVHLVSKHHAVTVGGYLTEILGSIPKTGETVQNEGLFFRILGAEPTHVTKIYIQRDGGKKAGDT